jgi:hypothetical protein
MSVTPVTLGMLFAGEVAGPRVFDFEAEEECERLKKMVEECEFNDYLNVVPTFKKVGVTVS